VGAADFKNPDISQARCGPADAQIDFSILDRFPRALPFMPIAILLAIGTPVSASLVNCADQQVAGAAVRPNMAGKAIQLCCLFIAMSEVGFAVAGARQGSTMGPRIDRRQAMD